MSFQVKNQLLLLVENDLAAYQIADDFVKDNADKLVVFTNAFKELQAPQHHNPSGLIEGVAASAVLVATKRWEVMYPTPAV